MRPSLAAHDRRPWLRAHRPGVRMPRWQWLDGGGTAAKVNKRRVHLHDTVQVSVWVVRWRAPVLQFAINQITGWGRPFRDDPAVTAQIGHHVVRVGQAVAVDAGPGVNWIALVRAGSVLWRRHAHGA